MSALDRLKAAREAQLDEHRLTLEVPGWSGLLHVRYRPIPFEQMAKLGEAAGNPLGVNLQALVDACDALLVKSDDGSLKSLADELRAAGQTVVGEVCFDQYATEALELTIVGDDGVKRAPESAREVVLGVFSGAVSPELAIIRHAEQLGEWMTGASQEVDAKLAGESATTTPSS